MASNFTTDQLKKMLQENQDKLDSLDSSDIVASKELKKSIDKISKLLLRTEKGILKELKESNKKSKKDKEETKKEIKSQFEDSRKDFKNRFSEFAQKNKLSMSSIRESYIENINEISEDYKKNLKRAFSDLKVNMSNDILENQKVIEQYLNNFASFITEKTTRAFNIAFNFLKTNMLNAFGKIKGLVTSLGDKLGSVIKGTWDRLKGAISHPIESIKNMISNSLSYVWQGIKAVGTLVKNVFVFVLKKIWEGLKWVAGAIWNVVKGVFKAIWTVVSWIGKSIFFMFKWISTFLLKVIWGSLVKITSFLLSAIWEGIKAVGSFLVSVMWGTIKVIAKTVFQIAFTIVKSIATMVVSLITSALAPWLGLIAVVGAGVYLLGYWMGWWGNKGNKETASIAIGGQNIKQGGFFENIGNWLVEKGGKFYKWIKEILFGDETTNSRGLVGTIWDGIKSALGIVGDFGSWLFDQLKIFWNWTTSKEKRDDYRLFEKNIAFYEKELKKGMLLDPDKMKEYTESLKTEKASLDKLYDTLPNMAKIIIKIEDIWEKNIKPAFNYIMEKIESATNWISNLITGNGSWSSPNDNSILGSIYNSLFGESKINTTSPTGGILGWMYKTIFGKNTIDWNTNGGLIGNIKEFMVVYVYQPIIDFIHNYITPFTTSIFNILGDILGWVSKKGKKFFEDIGRDSSLKMSRVTSEATASNLGFLTERKGFLSSQEHSEENLQKISSLNTNISKIEKSQKKAFTEIPEIYDAKVSKLIKKYIQNANTLYSLGINLDSDGSLSANSDLIRDQITSIINRNIDSDKFPDLKIYGMGFDYSSVKQLMKKILDGGTLQNETAELNSYLEDLYKGGFIKDDLYKSYKSIAKYIKVKETQIKGMLDGNVDIIKTGGTPKLRGEMLGLPGDFIYKTENFKDDIIKNDVKKHILRMITTEGIRTFHGRNIDAYSQIFGLARGGIVKPHPQGVNIIAAEAGSPEVILPLNRQGLTFIDEISKRLDYTSEHKEDMVNDIVTKLTKVIKDTVKSDKKETYATSSKQPVFLEDKSESSQLTKLLAMGMLNGR
jgi:predicted transcriptional regulator